MKLGAVMRNYEQRPCGWRAQRSESECQKDLGTSACIYVRELTADSGKRSELYNNRRGDGDDAVDGVYGSAWNGMQNSKIDLELCRGWVSQKRANFAINFAVKYNFTPGSDLKSS